MSEGEEYPERHRESTTWLQNLGDWRWAWVRMSG